jgi:hypothetical protein
MLRIREIVDGRGATTLRVGRLLQEPNRRLRVDLSAMTFVGRRGVVALRWLMTEGVAIVNSAEFIDALLKGDGRSWAN